MKISEERIKWVLRDYEGVLKYCDARYENYHRSYICEKQELQNFVLPKIDFEPRSSSGGDKRDLSDLYENWTERQKKFQKELISLMLEVEKEREEIHRMLMKNWWRRSAPVSCPVSFRSDRQKNIFRTTRRMFRAGSRELKSSRRLYSVP